MILIENVKFACLECIRGHRSTLCRHTMRPLLQVRSKGRPNHVFPYGNRNYRVAVYAEKVEDESPSIQGNDCKNTPVVILKTTEKHVMDITNGQMLGPYRENRAGMQCTPLITPETFVNSSVCCPSGSSKVRKSCGCNKKKVLRLKILRSYINKKMTHSVTNKLDLTQVPSNGSAMSQSEMLEMEPPSRSSESLQATSRPRRSVTKSGHPLSQEESRDQDDVENSKKVKTELSEVSIPSQMPMHLPQNDLAFSLYSSDASQKKFILQGSMAPHNAIEQVSSQADGNMQGISMNETGLFQVISVPSCSIPGTCGCSSDCRCPSCVVHNGAISNGVAYLSFNNDQQYGSNIPAKLEEQGISSNRFARELPRDFGQYPNYLAHYPSYDTQPPAFLSELQMELQSALQRAVNQLQDPQQGSSPCECPENECFCTNCEKHGIIDGYKLDDFFGSQTNILHPFPYG